MGTKKTTSTTANQTPQFVAPPTNQYYEKAANNFENIDLTSDIVRGFGQQDNLIHESDNHIFGANTSPEVAGKVRASRLFKSATDKGNALSGAKQQEINLKTGGYMSLGDATRPQMWNPGGTITQRTPFNFGEYFTSNANAAAGGAAAA